MRILIIEDEQPAVDRLIRLVKNFNAVYEIVACLDSVQDSIQWLDEHLHPDLIFLDVHLSDGNSFEILRGAGLSCPVIFTTSHSQYLVNAFEAFTVDYLFKPIKREAFTAAMTRFLQRRHDVSAFAQNEPSNEASAEPARILVKIGSHLKLLDLCGATYYLYEDRVTLYVTAENKKYPIDHSLDQLEKLLVGSPFYRVNRQCLINYKHIGDIITYSKSKLKVIMTDKLKTSIDVSTERTVGFKNWLLTANVPDSSVG